MTSKVDRPHVHPIEVVDFRRYESCRYVVDGTLNHASAVAQFRTRCAADGGKRGIGVAARHDLGLVERYTGFLDVTQPCQHSTGLQQVDHQPCLDFLGIWQLPEVPILGLERDSPAYKRWAFVRDSFAHRENTDQ